MIIDKLQLNASDVQSEYGFWLNWRTLSAPVPKFDFVSIPGMNGDIDLSDVLGDVYYESRELSIIMTHPDDNWHSDYESFVGAFHGRKCYIIFENDPNWYWYGRISVGHYDSKSHKMELSAKVNPYKLAVDQTIISQAITESSEANAHTIALTNGRMRVTPKVTVSNATNGATLKWGNNTKTLGNGEYYITGLTLDEGTLNVLAWGDGTVTFTYRQGAL